jgi:hypothetical protein
VHRLPVLALAYGLTLAGAAAARLPLGFFIKRVAVRAAVHRRRGAAGTLSIVTPATSSCRCGAMSARRARASPARG